MPVYKNEERNTWYASFYYTDWTGQRKRKKKEGFALKRDAQEYERSFKLKQSGSCDMAFRQMTELYLADCKIRQKPTSYAVKERNQQAYSSLLWEYTCKCRYCGACAAMAKPTLAKQQIQSKLLAQCQRLPIGYF